MLSWPATGDADRVWAINPDAWGNDTNLVGTAFQPMLFAGQYQDREAQAYSGTTTSRVHRPGVVLDQSSTYDSWTGSSCQMQLDQTTASTYIFGNSNPLGRSVANWYDYDVGPIAVSNNERREFKSFLPHTDLVNYIRKYFVFTFDSATRCYDKYPSLASQSRSSRRPFLGEAIDVKSCQTIVFFGPAEIVCATLSCVAPNDVERAMVCGLSTSNGTVEVKYKDVTENSGPWIHAFGVISNGGDDPPCEDGSPQPIPPGLPQ